MCEMPVIGGKQRECWTMEELLSTWQAYYQSIPRLKTEKHIVWPVVVWAIPQPLCRMWTGSLVTQTKEKIVCIYSVTKLAISATSAGCVTDVKKRWEVLRSSRQCYRCLKQGHMMDNCQRSLPCFYCKQTNHHSAVCWISLKTAQAMDTVNLQWPQTTW